MSDLTSHSRRRKIRSCVAAHLDERPKGGRFKSSLTPSVRRHPIGGAMFKSLHPTLIFILTLALSLPVLPVRAATIYVPGDYPNIQAGIDAAADFDTIELTASVYSGAGNRDIYLGKRVTLRSSNGDPSACLVDFADGQFGIRLLLGTDPQLTVIQGITFQNAFITDAPFGAICIVVGGAAFSNCRIINNRSESYEPNLGTGLGGGVRLYPGTKASFLNCTISGNSADGGGASTTRLTNSFHSSTAK